VFSLYLGDTSGLYLSESLKAVCPNNGLDAAYSPHIAMNYTFANFVVGSSSQFAQAAALAVATLPARAYNPLFLYGGTGMGKTHLLHAIGHFMEQQNPAQRVLYLAAEHFSRDLVGCLQHGHMETFRARYRHADALLMDDVQFLAGKSSSQEEFFHTFNTLYDAGKQIVLTSDRPAVEITPLQERLRSRFLHGLVADLQPPDLETRIAILCRKAEEQQLALPPSVALVVATHITANVRDLESCLAYMGAAVSLRGQDMSVTLAEKAVQQICAERDRTVTASRIQQIVATHFGLKVSELKSNRRVRSVAFPRQIAMFLCRELTDSSLPEIGRYFGGKDHTTVLHSCTKIARLEEDDEHVARLLWQLRQALGR
jgi:chromosomal replication initiator protein